MAVSKVPQGSALAIRVQSGMDGTGTKPKVLTRTFLVTAIATDDVLYEVGRKLAALQQHPVLGINRIDKFILENQ